MVESSSDTPLFSDSAHSESPPPFTSTITTMGILSDILAKIFPAGHPANRATTNLIPTAPAVPAPAPLPDMPPVDVPRILSDLAAKTPEKLDWHRSIVDLMRLLRLDGSLASRQKLARELQYAGDTDDTVAMNRWLHRRVMQHLAANGGRLPAGLIG
jgi:hypothetical protein